MSGRREGKRGERRERGREEEEGGRKKASESEGFSLVFLLFFFFFRFTLGVRFRHFFVRLGEIDVLLERNAGVEKVIWSRGLNRFIFSFIWFREKSGKATSGNFVNYEIICLWKGSLLLPRLSKKSLCETREKENGDKNKSKEDYGCFADHNARSYHGNYYHGYYYHLCLF